MAASGPHVLLDVGLKEGAPRDNRAEDVLSDAIVGGGADVAFLTAANVDDSESFSHGDLGLVVTHDSHVVHSAGGKRLSSR